MAKAIQYLLTPIADGLERASIVAHETAEMASQKVRAFGAAPMQFIKENPISTIIGGIGVYMGASTAWSLSSMVLGGTVGAAIAAPVALPIGAALGVGMISLNVMGFSALIFGGLRTIQSGAEMYKGTADELFDNTGRGLKNAQNALSRMLPSWTKKNAGGDFNAKATMGGDQKPKKDIVVTFAEKPAPKTPRS